MESYVKGDMLMKEYMIRNAANLFYTFEVKSEKGIIISYIIPLNSYDLYFVLKTREYNNYPVSKKLIICTGNDIYNLKFLLVSLFVFHIDRVM